MNLRKAVLLIGLVGGCVVANACSNGGYTYTDTCVNPKRWLYDSPYCDEMRLSDACMNPARDIYDDDFCDMYRADPDGYQAGYFTWAPGEGPDAGSDAGADAADAADAAPAMGNARVRIGRCGPDAPLGWTDPHPVWFGPIDEAPTECAETMGSYGGRAYSGLNKPTLDGCALCSCEPMKGTCSLPADTIHFRNAICSGDANVTTDFGPLEKWDGSCVSDHSIAANADCPACSGVLCVQSMYLSGSLEPSDGCKTVEIPVPKAITDVPTWNNVALACTSTTVHPSTALWEQFPELMKPVYNTCVPGGEGWRTCIQKEGGGATECDSASLFVNKVVMYAKSGFIDTRSCSACACESDGACVGTLNVYEDGACKNVVATELLDSNAPACDDLLPAGKAIGSKDVTDLHYVPGTCKATGGIPHGGVIEDEAKVVIWCCLTEESELYNIELE